MGLGVPFNIASYALLTKMIAHVCDIDAGELIHVMGDAHVYKDHIDALKIQVEREPRPFPTLKIARKVVEITDFKLEDFIIENYHPHGKLAIQMSAKLLVLISVNCRNYSNVQHILVRPVGIHVHPVNSVLRIPKTPRKQVFS